MIYLDEQEIIELRQRHHKCRDRKECDRIKAVILFSQGWSKSQIATALLLDESTVSRHIKEYQHKQKLTLDSGGAKRCYLDEQQTTELISHLNEKLYPHQKDIVAYVKQVYGVQFTVSGMNKWLHQHGFRYKKPKAVPHKFDEGQQAAFIERYELLRDTLPSDESLLFMDAVHPSQQTKLSYGWIQVGKDKPISTTGSKTRMNIVGAIELGRIEEAVVCSYDRVNTESICNFFEQLRLSHKDSKRIHLVLDQAGYHRSDVVIKKAENLNIKLHYLPPYSPNLNPIERLWKVMNIHARNNRYFASAMEFRQSIERFFYKTLPVIGQSLDDTINDQFEILRHAI